MSLVLFIFAKYMPMPFILVEALSYICNTRCHIKNSDKNYEKASQSSKFLWGELCCLTVPKIILFLFELNYDYSQVSIIVSFY